MGLSCHSKPQVGSALDDTHYMSTHQQNQKASTHPFASARYSSKQNQLIEQFALKLNKTTQLPIVLSSLMTTDDCLSADRTTDKGILTHHTHKHTLSNEGGNWEDDDTIKTNLQGPDSSPSSSPRESLKRQLSLTLVSSTITSNTSSTTPATEGSDADRVERPGTASGIRHQSLTLSLSSRNLIPSPSPSPDIQPNSGSRSSRQQHTRGWSDSSAVMKPADSQFGVSTDQINQKGSASAEQTARTSPVATTLQSSNLSNKNSLATAISTVEAKSSNEIPIKPTSQSAQIFAHLHPSPPTHSLPAATQTFKSQKHPTPPSTHSAHISHSKSYSALQNTPISTPPSKPVLTTSSSSNNIITSNNKQLIINTQSKTAPIIPSASFPSQSPSPSPSPYPYPYPTSSTESAHPTPSPASTSSTNSIASSSSSSSSSSSNISSTTSSLSSLNLNYRRATSPTVPTTPPQPYLIHHFFDDLTIYRAIAAYQREHKDEGLGPSWHTAHTLLSQSKSKSSQQNKHNKAKSIYGVSHLARGHQVVFDHPRESPKTIFSFISNLNSTPTIISPPPLNPRRVTA